MIFLKDRHSFASAVNFKKYPTVVIDTSERDEYGIVGAKVCIDNGFFRGGEPYYIKAVLRSYDDAGILQFHARGCLLSNRWCYSDAIGVLQYANVPIIKANQDILVCLINSRHKTVFDPVVLRTGERVDPHCSTPLELERYEIGLKSNGVV